MRPGLLALCFAALLLRPLPAAAQAAAADLAFLDGLCLVPLNTDDVGAVHAAHALIRSRGGRIAILSEPGLLLGWIPEAERADLIGEARIGAIYADPIAPGSLSLPGRGGQARWQALHVVEYFNAVKRGDIQRRAELEKAAATAYASDARARPPLEEWAYL